MNRQWILRAAVGVTGGVIAITVCAFGGWFPRELGYCLNITPSEPVGIYELVPGGITRGGLVLLKQPQDSAASILHRYIPTNLPLIKRVAAIHGDVVRVSTHGVYVNGVRWPRSVPLDHDGEGRTLRPYPFGDYRVAAGEVWVMSNHPRGLDSRYFGPVAAASVISRLEPLLTWTSAPLAQWLALGYALCLAALAILIAAITINALSARVVSPCVLKQE
jgi:conjugative transfer signal peptidase TraF